jgi:hypothetical protein
VTGLDPAVCGTAVTQIPVSGACAGPVTWPAIWPAESSVASVPGVVAPAVTGTGVALALACLSWYHCDATS